MAEVLEKTGKTVEEAYQAALAELGLPESRVSYEVIEEPSKGFLGIIGGKLAKVRVTVRELSPLEKAENFLKEIFSSMHLDVKMEREDKEESYIFNLVGENLGILIGKHGQTLDALQYLTNLAAGKSFRHHYFILLDVENYRERRQDTLEALARRLAGKVKRTGEEIRLEPMAAGERRIIHLALQDDHAVSTDSEGEAPYRYVVIRPKD